jgi:hypothetical protein
LGVRIGGELRRGFYHEVAFEDIEVFEEVGGAVFAWTPIDSLSVRRLTTSTIGRLLQSPYLGRLGSLTLSGEFGDAACDMIAEAPQLSRLSALQIITGLVSDSGALALARSSHLAAVVGFRLSRAYRLTSPTLNFLKHRFDHFVTG